MVVMMAWHSFRSVQRTKVLWTSWTCNFGVIEKLSINKRRRQIFEKVSLQGGALATLTIVARIVC